MCSSDLDEEGKRNKSKLDLGTKDTDSANESNSDKSESQSPNSKDDSDSEASHETPLPVAGKYHDLTVLGSPFAPLSPEPMLHLLEDDPARYYYLPTGHTDQPPSSRWHTDSEFISMNMDSWAQVNPSDGSAFATSSRTQLGSADIFRTPSPPMPPRKRKLEELVMKTPAKINPWAEFMDKKHKRG